MLFVFFFFDYFYFFLCVCVCVSKFLIPPCTQTHAAAVLIYLFVELFGWERKSRSIDRCEQSELRVFYFFPYSSERIEFELPPNHVPRSGCPSVDLTQRTEKWISTRPENNENRNWFTVRSNFFCFCGRAGVSVCFWKGSRYWPFTNSHTDTHPSCFQPAGTQSIPSFGPIRTFSGNGIKF